MGDTVLAEWTFTSDCVRQSGLGSFSGTSTVEFLDGKISAGRPMIDLTDEQLAQLADALACTAALSPPLPAAGSGGLVTNSSRGPALWTYAIAAFGALLALGGAALWRHQKSA